MVWNSLLQQILGSKPHRNEHKACKRRSRWACCCCLAKLAQHGFGSSESLIQCTAPKALKTMVTKCLTCATPKKSWEAWNGVRSFWDLDALMKHWWNMQQKGILHLDHLWSNMAFFGTLWLRVTSDQVKYPWLPWSQAAKASRNTWQFQCHNQFGFLRDFGRANLRRLGFFPQKFPLRPGWWDLQIECPDTFHLPQKPLDHSDDY